MKTGFKILLLLFFWFCSATYAKTSEIEKLIKTKGLNLSSLGLVISKAHPDNTITPVYNLNGNKLFVPASVVKIATLSALYKYYPPSYIFTTSFISGASIEKGILKGDLILKGGGDSSFTSESLWNLVNNLSHRGIREVQGDLLIDDTLYNLETPLPSSDRSYMALISASSFNWNSVSFRIRPSQTFRNPAFVTADPENSYIKIISRVKTGKKNKITIQRQSISPVGEIFKIRGTIDINKQEIFKYRNITNPALWLGENARNFLAHRGIKISGRVRKGICSKDCQILAKWESRPFSFHSYNLMKYSSNFVTRMLVAHLPLLKGKNKGDLSQGLDLLRSYLMQNEGLKNFHLEEPSGLSRKNKFAPKDLQKILIRSGKNFYSPEMLSSYPLAGGKGTLKDRFKNLPPSAMVRAKTGSLSGVLGLAGWASSLKDKNNQYIFVFIFNGKARKSPKAGELFDEIILSLLTPPDNKI